MNHIAKFFEISPCLKEKHSQLISIFLTLGPIGGAFYAAYCIGIGLDISGHITLLSITRSGDALSLISSLNSELNYFRDEFLKCVLANIAIFIIYIFILVDCKIIAQYIHNNTNRET